jgi:hypothetical protein
MRTAPVLIIATTICLPLAAAPQLKPSPKDSPPLVGSVWTGKSSEGLDQTITFLADGKMKIVKGERTIDKCSWTQDGAKVMWEVNDRYAEYTGTIVGDKIEASAHNKAGKDWTITMTRNRGK